MTSLPYSLNEALAYRIASMAADRQIRSARSTVFVDIAHEEVLDIVSSFKGDEHIAELKQLIFRFIVKMSKDYRESSTFAMYHPELLI